MGSARLLAEPAPHGGLHQALAVPSYQHGPLAGDLTDQARMAEQHHEIASRYQLLQRAVHTVGYTG